MTGKPTKTLRATKQQPDDAGTEGTEEEAAKSLEEQRREGELPATSGSSVKSLLTDPNYEEQDWANLPGAPKDGGIVLGPNENMRVDGEPDDSNTQIKLNTPVYRAHLPMGSKRWGFILEYPAGAVIPMSMVRPLNQEVVEVTPKNDDTGTEKK